MRKEDFCYPFYCRWEEDMIEITDDSVIEEGYCKA